METSILTLPLKVKPKPPKEKIRREIPVKEAKEEARKAANMEVQTTPVHGNSTSPLFNNNGGTLNGDAHVAGVIRGYINYAPKTYGSADKGSMQHTNLTDLEKIQREILNTEAEKEAEKAASREVQSTSPLFDNNGGKVNGDAQVAGAIRGYINYAPKTYGK